jgi:hypothetical protein
VNLAHRANDRSKAILAGLPILLSDILQFSVCQCVFSWGLALSLFEIVRAEGVRPFVLLGALVMVVAGGAWLLDEFVLRR